MTLDELLDELEDVRRQGSGYVARCPAHDDRQASLSIAEGDEVPFVLKCHAGCTYEEVMKALPNQTTEFQTASKNPDEPEAIYTYVDEHGLTLFQVCRFPGKKFRQRNAAGEWNVRDVRRVPYRLPEVVAQAQQGGVIYIVEGEKDVERLRELGKVATCNMGGAGKWQSEWAQFFTGAIVHIVADKDEPGRKHATGIRDNLLRVAKTVYIWQAKRGKDVSDHLDAGFTVEQLVPLKESRPASIITSEQMVENALAALDSEQRRDSFYPNPWGIEQPEFVPGRLYVLSGYTGDGKSTLALQVYRQLCEQGVRVGLVSLEMTEADLRNRLICHTGICSLRELERPWHLDSEKKVLVRAEIERMRSWPGEIIFDTSAGFEKAADYIDDEGYEFLIHDHLHRTENISGGEEAAIAKEVRGFTNIALNYNIPVLLLGQLRRPHPQSNLPRPNVHDFKGSGAIEQEAAMAMSIWHCRDAAGNKTHGAELSLLKNRHGRTAIYPLHFDGPRFRFAKQAEPVLTGGDGW